MSAMRIYKINEIFYSLQGEGAHVGRASVFVRFAQCNLACAFCDTDFAHVAYRFDKNELESFVLALLEKEHVASKPQIVFTGGEPTLQLCESEPILNGFYRCVETNGYKVAPRWIEWVTFSPKTKPIAADNMRRANEVKILYSLFSDDEMIAFARDYPDKQFFVQAIDDGQRPISHDSLILFCKKNPQFRLSLQTHKILEIR